MAIADSTQTAPDVADLQAERLDRRGPQAAESARLRAQSAEFFKIAKTCEGIAQAVSASLTSQAPRREHPADLIERIVAAMPPRDRIGRQIAASYARDLEQVEDLIVSFGREYGVEPNV